jgi:hypothetical protein
MKDKSDTKKYSASDREKVATFLIESERKKEQILETISALSWDPSQQKKNCAKQQVEQ